MRSLQTLFRKLRMCAKRGRDGSLLLPVPLYSNERPAKLGRQHFVGGAGGWSFYTIRSGLLSPESLPELVLPQEIARSGNDLGEGGERVPAAPPHVSLSPTVLPLSRGV